MNVLTESSVFYQLDNIQTAFNHMEAQSFMSSENQPGACRDAQFATDKLRWLDLFLEWMGHNAYNY